MVDEEEIIRAYLGVIDRLIRDLEKIDYQFGTYSQIEIHDVDVTPLSARLRQVRRSVEALRRLARAAEDLVP